MDGHPRLGEVMYTSMLRENHDAHSSSKSTMSDKISKQALERTSPATILGEASQYSTQPGHHKAQQKGFRGNKTDSAKHKH